MQLAVALVCVWMDVFPSGWWIEVFVSLVVTFILGYLLLSKGTTCKTCGSRVQYAEGRITLEEAESMSKMTRYTKIFGERRFGRHVHWRAQFFYCEQCHYRQVVSVTNSKLA